MALVIADSIRKREFKRGRIAPGDLRVLLRAARIDLGTIIKGSDLPGGTHLLKAYATTPDGPRRILYLLAADDGSLFLLARAVSVSH